MTERTWRYSQSYEDLVQLLVGKGWVERQGRYIVWLSAR